MRFKNKLVFRTMGAALLLALFGCATVAPTDDDNHTAQPQSQLLPINNAWSRASQTNSSVSNPLPAPNAGWQHISLPGKHATDYAFERVDGRDVMAVNAISSASLLRQKVHIAPTELQRIKFSWKVPELIAQADLGVPDRADSPVRIVLAFEGDRSRFSVKNALLSELAHTLTGEPLPYATLMYVWCNSRAPGSVITSPRTDRIRKIVVESGGKNLNQWLDYERDIRADYEKAFGEPPGALVAIGIMTDTDNTHATTHAWYGKVALAGAANSSTTALAASPTR
jgi:hypothetical protein